MRKFVLIAAGAVVGACNLIPEKVAPPRVQVVPISRRDIEVFADASGNIEPIANTEVKSKASGQVIRLIAEVGVLYQKGDTLIQLDTKEVDQQVQQAAFDTLNAAQKLANDVSDRQRQDSLLKVNAITKVEHDRGLLTVLNSQNALNKSKNALELALLRQSDATVLAPITGTVIQRQVQIGQIVQSSTSGLNAGTTLLTMTDLTQLRVRASFNEIDIANIDTGMTAMITVDAYPDEPIPGTIVKREPMAQNVQSVTMFPVIINIDNTEGRLMPGMNGSIQVWVERRQNAIAVPNDAIRQPAESPFLAQVLASILGREINADSLKEVIDEQVTRLGRPGFTPTSSDSGNAAAAPPQGNQPPAGRTGGGGAFGDVDMSIPEFQGRGGGGQGGGGGNQGRGGGRGGGRQGRGGMPTPEECTGFRTKLGKTAATKKEYDGFINELKGQQVDRIKVNTSLRGLYTKAGIDTVEGRRCQMLDTGPVGFGGGGGRGGGGRGMGGGGGGGGAGGPQFRQRNRQAPTRNALVFVVPNGVPTPGEPVEYQARVIRTGLGSYEFTEVVEGLREGEHVALMSAAIIAVQQQQSRAKLQQNMGGAFPGMPGGGGNPGGGRGGGNPGGGGPGGGGGGGGGGRGGGGRG